MIQKDPRYNKLTAAQMDMVVRRETIRADFAYNMGIKPEEVGDDIVDLLLMEGMIRGLVSNKAVVSAHYYSKEGSVMAIEKNNEEKNAKGNFTRRGRITGTRSKPK